MEEKQKEWKGSFAGLFQKSMKELKEVTRHKEKYKMCNFSTFRKIIINLFLL